MEALLLLLGGIAGVFLLIAYGSFVTGLLVYKFWYWFIIPVFSSAPHISLMQAIGMGIALTLVKTTSGGKKRYISGTEIKEEVEWAQVILYPWLILLIGWIAHLLFN